MGVTSGGAYATPRHATPQGATPRHATPRHATPVRALVCPWPRIHLTPLPLPQPLPTSTRPIPDPPSSPPQVITLRACQPRVSTAPLARAGGEAAACVRSTRAAACFRGRGVSAAAVRASFVFGTTRVQSACLPACRARVRGAAACERGGA